ncbi:zinc-ribbon domain-containing protein [Caminicella sporogenes DSM 14501]|uniref:Zinc-ribbon domain-containing protein n=1 Tax=Caminicella sporogenes DSM 14501 TaxID=1121266 RepID=A0A1M6REW7_9FIRM|nr:zinc-ribbon domain-containing protein [Caminicella sporogenes]RKD25215.1 hypothetical protein BET04_03065 [Caminicella sporogenes]SHK30953.1 zinc-ribbon domain-containing protein [Caminicella sporogenes DSM 14501]
MFCKNCGKEIADDAKFCSKCGIELVDKTKKVDGLEDEDVSKDENILSESIKINKKTKRKKIKLKIAIGIISLLFIFIIIITTISNIDNEEVNGKKEYTKFSEKFNQYMLNYLNSNLEEKLENKYLEFLNESDDKLIKDTIANILRDSLNKGDYKKVNEYISKLEKIEKADFNLSEMKNAINQINANIKEIEKIEQEIKSIAEKLTFSKDVIYVEGYVVNQVRYDDTFLGQIANELEDEYIYGITLDRDYNLFWGYLPGESRAVVKSETPLFDGKGPFDMYLVHIGEGNYISGDGFEVTIDEYRPATDEEINAFGNYAYYEESIQTLRSSKDRMINEIELARKKIENCLKTSKSETAEEKAEMEKPKEAENKKTEAYVKERIKELVPDNWNSNYDNENYLVLHSKNGLKLSTTIKRGYSKIADILDEENMDLRDFQEISQDELFKDPGPWPYSYSNLNIDGTKEALYMSVGSDGSFLTRFYVLYDNLLVEFKIDENYWDDGYDFNYTKEFYKEILKIIKMI